MVFPNGLKMCWGEVDLGYVNSSVLFKKVTFPVAYSAKPSFMAMISDTTNAAIELTFNLKGGNVTTTSANIYLHESASDVNFNGSSTKKVQWFAIGY